MKWERKEAISPFDDFDLYPHGSLLHSISFVTIRMHYKEEENSYEIHIYLTSIQIITSKAWRAAGNMNIHSITTVDDD